MPEFEDLMNTKTPFLTDGGLETWLFFQRGFEAPEFAAIALIEDEAVRAALNEYFDGFLTLAESSGTGFVLDTNTWRGCPVWAEKLGLTKAELLELSRKSVAFARSVKERWSDRVHPILINGVIGPSGDGYSPDTIPSAEEAQKLHQPQISTLAAEGVDMLSAITITNVSEAIGIVRAAQAESLPIAVSFTVETDGRLPSGDLLGEAIEAVDAATGNYPAYYMINCAHPNHFHDAISTNAEWISRVGGTRANASRMSHEELDNAEELDQGDPAEFGGLHGELAGLLPNLRVVGGCCGTDLRHIECVSHQIFEPQAA